MVDSERPPDQAACRAAVRDDEGPSTCGQNVLARLGDASPERTDRLPVVGCVVGVPEVVVGQVLEHLGQGERRDRATAELEQPVVGLDRER